MEKHAKEYERQYMSNYTANRPDVYELIKKNEDLEKEAMEKKIRIETALEELRRYEELTHVIRQEQAKINVLLKEVQSQISDVKNTMPLDVLSQALVSCKERVSW